jgi:dTDP-4-amino-4,6-dideoxygalactose transaminase
LLQQRPLRYPLIYAKPARLSQLTDELAEIEESGVYSNYGPVNQRFEKRLNEQVFGGAGACLTVCNATLGLMLAIRAAADPSAADVKFALMPSFTFAATGHAALWAGLRPLLCDSDPETWTASAEHEETLLQQYGSRVGVIVPYATFGAEIDLDRYASFARRYNVAIVVDAAASLGTVDSRGRAFGAGAPFPIVYSLHATKSFATAEAGVVHCGDPELIERLRRMGNFGFDRSRSANMPGLNSKLSEIGALLALEKLKDFEAISDHRAKLAERYRAKLPGFAFQSDSSQRQAMVFMPVLLPDALSARRDQIMERLAARGIGVGAYFSPHLAQQPYFADAARFGPLPVADLIARSILCMPIYDDLTVTDVSVICGELRAVCRELLAIVSS